MSTSTQVKTKAEVEDSYTKFQELFIKYYYAQFKKANEAYSLDKIKSEIIEKWNSFTRSTLKELFIIYEKTHNLDHFAEFDTKKGKSNEHKINDDNENLPYGVKHFKKCLKMFGTSHFPTNLTFEFQEQGEQGPQHLVYKADQLKTPIKKQKEQLWHLETQEQTEKKEKEQKNKNSNLKQRIKLELEFLEQNYESYTPEDDKNVKKSKPSKKTKQIKKPALPA